MRAGLPLTHTVSFASGFPDAAVSWVVDDLDSGEITPAPGAVSIDILIQAVVNELGVGQFSDARTLSWWYTVGGQEQAGSFTYQIEAPLGFGVTTDGVRAKLGLEAHELADQNINLLKAYLSFTSRVDVTGVSNAQALETLAVRDAIEATAALPLIPTLQLRIAQKESSGTSQFQRFDVDWSVVEAGLYKMIADAETLITGVEVNADDLGDLFVVVSPETDIFPGA